MEVGGAVSAWLPVTMAARRDGGTWPPGRVAGPAAMHVAWQGHLPELSHGKNLNLDTLVLSSS